MHEAIGVDMSGMVEAPSMGHWLLPSEPVTSKAIASGSLEAIHSDANYPKNPQTWLLLVLNALQSHYSSIRLSTLDMTCAFSVSDLRKPDMPLIYCSPTFEQLTKYTLEEVEGRNHRFMQSPTGDQQAGEVRKHTDHASVIRMMQDLSIGSETQVTLSNYVKSSERWTNLLTMIPIVLNPLGVVDFYVGLQLNIDLFPENILKLADGSFEIDYKVKPQIERPLAVAFDEDNPLEHNVYLQSQSQSHASQWALTLTNEVVDSIFIVSMIGKVLQVSPSITTLLGYEPEYLVGTYLSSILHTSDLAHVLNQFSAVIDKSPLDFVARLRQYSGDYIWVTFVGQVLATVQEQKLIVLSGRRYNLLGGKSLGGPIHEKECWCRISLDGLILFASSHASTLLGRPQAQLLGTYFKDSIPEVDRPAFDQAISATVAGTTTSIEHECCQNYPSYGNTVKCISEIYPGALQVKDAQTFLLVRTSPSGRSNSAITKDTREGVEESEFDRRASNTPAQYEFQTAQSISLQPIASGQILSVLNEERDTAWQLELQQARVINQKLQAAVQLARDHQAQPPSTNPPRIYQCSICQTKETTQWRTGYKGARLCNSCGLSWRKRMK